MQRKNRGEGTSLPMGELVKDPAALARLAQSGEARQLVSMLKQSGGVQEAAQAAGTITNELLSRLGPRLERVVLP